MALERVVFSQVSACQGSIFEYSQNLSIEFSDLLLIAWVFIFSTNQNGSVLLHS